MAPGASSTNDRTREYYAPRVTEPSTTKQRQSVPHVKHQKPQRPIVVHTEIEDVDQGCLGEIKNYKAGDEFVLLWKWADDFMDKRRAKKDSSKSHNVTKPTSRQAKPTTSSSHEAGQNPKPAGVPSVGGVRRQVTDREDLCEYKTQSRAPWGRLRSLHQKFKDQRAKKKPDQARQKKGERLTGGQATERTDQSTRGHSTNHPQTTSLPPDQAHAVNRTLGIAEKPVSVYNKKRGKVQKHAVQITYLPPIHNSVHLEHTPSNNYRTKPPAALKNDSARDTHFSDFIREERGPVSRETKWTRAGPDHDDEPVRNSHFSSKLDPAKAMKRAKEAEKAKGPKCYICSSTHCPGGYRDNISKLWVCAACQQKENIGPKQCSYCGTPNSPNTTYADNGLWLCTNCRNPTEPTELPPIAKLSPKAPSKPNDYFLKSNERNPNAGYEAALSEYDSDHLYSDDSYETRATTPPAQKSSGLGVAFEDPEEKKEDFRPTPPLKDSKYYQESPTFPAMDYNQSYLHKPGAKHPYAPSTPTSSSPSTKKATTTTTRRNPSVTSAPKAKKTLRHQPKQSFNPTRYPYPSPPSSPPPPSTLHKPRPASSVYPTDERTAEFPYPPPPIPAQYAKNPRRRRRSSSAQSRAALERTEPLSPGSLESLNRRSSWYDFWKPVFEKNGERGVGEF